MHIAAADGGGAGSNGKKSRRRSSGRWGRRRLRVVDSALLKDIKEVRPEVGSPHLVTILVKRPIKAKRWRLILNSRRVAEKLVQEVRRRVE